MFKSALAILTVIAVVALHSLLKLGLPPFLTLRRLYRDEARTAR